MYELLFSFPTRWMVAQPLHQGFADFYICCFYFLNPWTRTISISTTISLLASIIVRWSRHPRFCLGRIHFGLKLGTAFAPWSRATAQKAHEKHFSVPRPTVLHWQLLRHPLSNDNRSSVKAHKLGTLYSPAVSQHHDTPTARGGEGDSTSTANAEEQDSHGGKVKASCESDWMWPMAARREPDEWMQ